MTQYGYEIWYEGQTLRETSMYDDWYNTEADAEEVAEEQVEDIIADWQSEGSWAGEVAEDFDIKIKEREVLDEGL